MQTYMLRAAYIVSIRQPLNQTEEDCRGAEVLNRVKHGLGKIRPSECHSVFNDSAKCESETKFSTKTGAQIYTQLPQLTGVEAKNTDYAIFIFIE